MSKPFLPQICPQCGNEFIPIQKGQIYCQKRRVKKGGKRTISACASAAQNMRKKKRDRRDYYKAKRLEYKATGRCMKCGHLKENSEYVTCSDCLDGYVLII